jgi:sensor histidine kinase regulating citrate/malate metabolism
MLFPISQFILLIGWFGCAFRSMTTMDTLTEVIGAISCVAADTALYFAIRGMAERVELRVQNTMLEKQIDAQTVHYAALTEQYENIRRMRHDIDNHLYTMRILLENGKADEAASYLAELNPGSEYVPSLGRCHNPVVDAFLYTRIKDLRTQGIQVEADVDLPGEMTISNADLVSAFGNLLDNAAEAVHGAAQKRISITAGIKSGYLVIKTENPSSPAPDTQKRRIPELERGVGFHILTGLAEKYNGSFTACAEGSMFDTSLILQEMNALA